MLPQVTFVFLKYSSIIVHCIYSECAYVVKYHIWYEIHVRIEFRSYICTILGTRFSYWHGIFFYGLELDL